MVVDEELGRSQPARPGRITDAKTLERVTFYLATPGPQLPPGNRPVGIRIQADGHVQIPDCYVPLASQGLISTNLDAEIGVGSEMRVGAPDVERERGDGQR